MATNEVPRGPISAYVVANVKRLRAERRWSLVELSEEMGRIGRPMLSSGLHRLESGRRRVDVDDLAALALAFGVSPITLLLPWSGHDGVVHLTETVTSDVTAAWEWLRAVRPIELPEDQQDADFAELAFQRQAIPPEGRNHIFMQRSDRYFIPIGEYDDAGELLKQHAEAEAVEGDVDGEHPAAP